MAGTFYSIKNWLKQKYDGRYMSVLLSELANREPATFARILELSPMKGAYDWKPLCNDIRRKRVKLVREFSFFTLRARRRQSDLAFITKDGTLAALVELKDKDEFHDKQLDHYLEKVEVGVPFIHISRNSPSDATDQIKMENARAASKPVVSIRYRDIYKILIKETQPFAMMLRDYLEDIGVGAYVPIEEKEERALAFLLTQMLGFPHATGLKRLNGKQAIEELPKLLSRMFGNIEFIAEWVREHNTKILKTSFNRKFFPRPEFDLQKLSKALANSDLRDEASVSQLPGEGKFVQGGEVVFACWGKIRTESPQVWLYVELGFGLYISKGSSESPPRGSIVQPYLYSAFSGQALKYEDTYVDTDYLKAFPTENHALLMFHNIISNSLEKARKVTTGPTNKALKLFAVPPQP